MFLVDIVTVDDDPAWPHAGVFGSQRVRSLWESEGLQDFPEGLFGCASVTFFFSEALMVLSVPFSHTYEWEFSQG